jgi:hypothetical protein
MGLMSMGHSRGHNVVVQCSVGGYIEAALHK